MRFNGSIAAGFTLLFCAALSFNAEPMHPVRRRLRDEDSSVPDPESPRGCPLFEELVKPKD